MDKPVSFDVNHTDLQPGVYVSRVDLIGNAPVVTLDIRLFGQSELKKYGADSSIFDIVPKWFQQETGGYVEEWASGLHSLEHTFATLLRSGKIFAEGTYQTVYIGPGGCLSMFYLLLSPVDHNLSPIFFEKENGKKVASSAITLLVKSLFQKAIEYISVEGVPATQPSQCGNPELHDSVLAKIIAQHFLDQFESWKTEYPEAR